MSASVTPLTPSNIDFATEVKSDRLNLLWKVTIVVCSIVVVMSLTLLTFDRFPLSLWVGFPFTLIVGCLLARLFLKRGSFFYAAWSYTLAGLVGVSVALAGAARPEETTELIVRAVPFLYVLVVFIGGLLLPPVAMFKVCALATAGTIIIPFVVLGDFSFFGGYQIFAIVMVFLAATLAAQVTGDLYAITEWALLNYQRERRTNTELFDNRQKLELTLKRSEALSDRLKITNVDLENARATAEAAKNFRGQFLANMSHELRTPLNAIIGFSETMLKFPIMYDEVELPEAYRADMNQIYTSGKQLLTLINDILDLAKVDAGKLEVQRELFDLDPIFKATLSTASGLIGTKDIVLRTDLPAFLPKVYGDSNRVRQVLLNLYSNAVKFTDHGEIVLSARLHPDMLQISVRDTGSGIPSTSLELIFEEFKQADNSRRDPRAGSGLGLAISRQLVSLMGGRIWAESTLGRGSTFHFTVPLLPVELLPKTMPDALSQAQAEHHTNGNTVSPGSTQSVTTHPHHPDSSTAAVGQPAAVHQQETL
jgi:signal transduction histidine kinase